MLFCVNESPSHLGGQRLLWNLLRLAFGGEAGVAYFRYPFYRLPEALPAPEFVMLSRRLGLWLLTCDGVRSSNVQSFEYRPALERGEVWLEELRGQIESEPALQGVPLRYAHRLALPFVDEKTWLAHAQTHEGVDGDVVLPREHLQPRALRVKLSELRVSGADSLTDDQWRLLQSVLRGRVMSAKSPRVFNGVPGSTTPSGLMAQVDLRTTWLDEIQERVAYEVPEGPQRIRGVAGSGKTSLMVQRAAVIHAAHPDWDIAFLVHTRHRETQIAALISASFERLTGRAPNLERLRVWHAWGDEGSPGFLRSSAEIWGQRRLGPGDAQYRLGWRQADSRGLAWACEELEADIGEHEVLPFLDVLLMDEGQDMPAALYRLALRALRPPGRLYWAFDESQGLNDLLVPRAANLFGLHASGRPRIDLAGTYPSGIPKSRQLRRSYRTPAEVLGVAQALGMGLLRRGGPLQSVMHRDEWVNLGFQLEGDLSAAGIRARSLLVVERAEEASAHPMDHLEFEEDEVPPRFLEVIEVEEEQATVAAIVAGVRGDLDAGLAAEGLLVIVMPQSQPTLEKLRVALNHVGIPAQVADDDREGAGPGSSGCVTIASVESSRGCEAWKVYVCGLQRVTAESVTTSDEETLLRNQALVAMTRTRLWCVAIGEKGPFMAEATALFRACGRFRFPAFDQSALNRDISSWVLGGLGDSERMIELN